MLHCSKLKAARASLAALASHDESITQKATQKAKVEYEALKSVERYIVFNPRTGEIASQHWLNTHIAVQDGKPVLKRKNGKACPFVVTLGFVLNGGDCNLTLKTQPDKPARPVRCYDLRNGGAQSKFQFLMTGYEHLAEDLVDEFSCDGSASEAEDFLVDDEDGLPGFIYLLTCFVSVLSLCFCFKCLTALMC